MTLLKQRLNGQAKNLKRLKKTNSNGNTGGETNSDSTHS